MYPVTKPFFQLKELYNTEKPLRRDAHQWETSVKRARSFLGTTPNDPVFDIHYNARKGGHLYLNAKPIPCALVVTVQAKNAPDLYDRIMQRYRAQLEALKPVIQVPIRTNISEKSADTRSLNATPWDLVQGTHCRFRSARDPEMDKWQRQS